MSTSTLTYREVKTAIDTYVGDYPTSSVTTDKAVLNTIVEAISTGDRPVRDYIIGLPAVVSLPQADTVLSEFVMAMPTGQLRHALTPLSQFVYEAGDAPTAYRFLEIALTEESDYSLAVLLKQYYDKGVTSSAFREMREGIHPIVIALMENDEVLSNY